MNERSVSDMGEWALIESIRRHLPDPPAGEIWSGDDAAVLEHGSERLVLTTDVIVEHLDFDLAYSPPQSIGSKAVAVNASDVAAMGARPRWSVATLTLPRDTSGDVVDGFARGMAEEAGRIHAALVGGDISEGRYLSLSVAMVGTLEGPPVTRSGAGVGDIICVTGSLGGAAAGLHMLREGVDGKEEHSALKARQLTPHARSIEGPLLAPFATAMIDVSDGLLADLGHVLDASQVGCRVDPERVPLDPALSGVDLPRSALELALTGGEDLELLFTLPPGELDGARSALHDTGTPLSVIGEIVESGRTVGDRTLDSWKDKGWEHLQRR